MSYDCVRRGRELWQGKDTCELRGLFPSLCFPCSPWCRVITPPGLQGGEVCRLQRGVRRKLSQAEQKFDALYAGERHAAALIRSPSPLTPQVALLTL
eukprot:scaffold106868_cov78-Phaeocystis_antarctica.AAC.4